MLISRDEVRFDFGGALFDLSKPEERGLLGWIFNQFLYGEVTGIQCGHWLYHAPSLQAASFLAKQAGEELAHVRKILRILSILEEPPAKPHWAIQFLSTGMMGKSWGEHVALEMALGEGLVLAIFYAMTDTIPQPEIKKILETATKDEETHVEFGEKETIDWLAKNPHHRSLLLGQALLQIWALSKLKRFVLKRLKSGANANHPVLERFGDFYDHVLKTFERRVEKLGLLSHPLSETPIGVKLRAFGALLLWQIQSRIPFRGGKLLTSTYLEDPILAAERTRFRK